MNVTWRMGGPALMVLVALTGCSSGNSPAAAPASATSGATRSTAVKDPDRAFQACLRDHGVTIPEPGTKPTVQAEPGQETKLRAAIQACQSLLAGGELKPMSPADLDKARAVAKCMRQQGIDFPDPDPNNPGSHVIGGDGLDPALIEKAMKECGVNTGKGAP